MYQYPETNGTDRDMLDAGPVDEVARAAEAAGFTGFSFTEHPVPGGSRAGVTRVWTHLRHWRS